MRSGNANDCAFCVLGSGIFLNVEGGVIKVLFQYLPLSELDCFSHSNTSAREHIREELKLHPNPRACEERRGLIVQATLDG